LGSVTLDGHRSPLHLRIHPDRCPRARPRRWSRPGATVTPVPCRGAFPRTFCFLWNSASFVFSGQLPLLAASVCFCSARSPVQARPPGAHMRDGW